MKTQKNAGQTSCLSLASRSQMETGWKPVLLWLALFSFALSACAQSSARFALTRSVIAGGGTTFSSSSRFQLGSTVGQPLAAVPASARYSIQGGFWVWPAPVIFAPAKVGTNFVFSFQTEPGKTYAVQFVDFLAALNWQNLTSVMGDGTAKTVTNAVPDVTQRFYRLIEQ